MFSRFLFRVTLGTLLCLAITVSGFGQCTNGKPPCTAPSNTGPIIWVITSVVAGVAVVYFMHKHKGESNNQPSFVGCTELSDNAIVLTDEKDSQPYVILPGSVAVKPGDRVEVLGKKDEDSTGRIALQVFRLVKDYGPCKSTKVIDAP
jgi:hypothetical protein